jgi:hypothetical protein
MWFKPGTDFDDVELGSRGDASPKIETASNYGTKKKEGCSVA